MLMLRPLSLWQLSWHYLIVWVLSAVRLWPLSFRTSSNDPSCYSAVIFIHMNSNRWNMAAVRHQTEFERKSFWRSDKTATWYTVGIRCGNITLPKHARLNLCVFFFKNCKFYFIYIIQVLDLYTRQTNLGKHSLLSNCKMMRLLLLSRSGFPLAFGSHRFVSSSAAANTLTFLCCRWQRSISGSTRKQHRTWEPLWTLWTLLLFIEKFGWHGLWISWIQNPGFHPCCLADVDTQYGQAKVHLTSREKPHGIQSFHFRYKPTL